MPLSPEHAHREETTRRELVRLMRRMAAGDASALRPLYLQTSGRVFALLQRMLPTEMAEEVLQEVYVSVWRNAAGFDPERGFSPASWITTIARNRALDRLRAERRRRGREGHGLDAAGLDDAEAAEVSDPSPTALERMETDEELRRLAECLGTMEDRAAELVRAAFFGGLTYADLARREEVPVGTMKSWMRRNLQRLRACLETV